MLTNLCFRVNEIPVFKQHWLLSKNSSFIVKQNMTMMLLPEKKICYLMPLSEEVPTPAKLESDLNQTEVRTCSFFSDKQFEVSSVETEKLFLKHF